ncbi:hypothetical protein BDK51DRAFT_30756, partial [Blyttiomyces helicus]
MWEVLQLGTPSVMGVNPLPLVSMDLWFKMLPAFVERARNGNFTRLPAKLEAYLASGPHPEAAQHFQRAAVSMPASARLRRRQAGDKELIGNRLTLAYCHIISRRLADELDAGMSPRLGALVDVVIRALKAKKQELRSCGSFIFSRWNLRDVVGALARIAIAKPRTWSHLVDVVFEPGTEYLRQLRRGPVKVINEGHPSAPAAAAFQDAVLRPSAPASPAVASSSSASSSANATELTTPKSPVEANGHPASESLVAGVSATSPRPSASTSPAVACPLPALSTVNGVKPTKP